MISGFFSPRGRIARREWWWRYAVVVCASVPSTVVYVTYKDGPLADIPPAALLLLIASFPFLFWTSFCVTVRRLHDLGRSAWWWLWLLVPVVGGPFVWMICGLFPGEDGPNAYGDPPGAEGGGRDRQDEDRSLSDADVDAIFARHAAERATPAPAFRLPTVVEKRAVPPAGLPRQRTFGKRGTV